MSLPLLPVIVGPTASGKTLLSIELAAVLNAEIISADSRQIFKYMNIVTAKPSPETLRLVKHHFIDIINPDETYDAGRFGTEARECFRSVHGAGRRVIVAGGSGLYVKSMIDGFFQSVARNEEVRSAIRDRIQKHGTIALHEELRKIDPKAAEQIHPNDAKRIERALEVFEITGQPISGLRQAGVEKPPFRPVLIGLTAARDRLYTRINARVDEMLAAGAVDETRDLLERGYTASLVSMEGLGYREIVDFLNGKLNEPRMIELFKQRSRNFAKRQLTWFNKDHRIKWYDVDNISLQELAGQVAESIKKEEG